jgi:hypothetical protein
LPDLNFQVESAEALPFAAVPSLLFKLRVTDQQETAFRAITLQTQIRILANQRRYNPDEQTRLRELFGETRQWGDTLKPLLWTHTLVQIPSFTGSAMVDMTVPCTYDFDVLSARYFHAMEDEQVPLEFLFSGTMFYAGETGLQVEQIPWEKEARFQMPVRVWKTMMEQYFPNSAWLRLRSDVFDRLYRYRSRKALLTWEAALEDLLGGRD